MGADLAELTPKRIVQELDKYIIGQEEAKRCVAIALRNRWRRQHLPPELRDEVAPKNIIMIGPTGVGKTEIARRLARLVRAPFLKVEATKFTEVGYVGRDVESMVRDLMDIGVNMVREERMREVQEKAAELAEERVLDLLLPPSETYRDSSDYKLSREKLRAQLREGKFDDRFVELELQQQGLPLVQIMGVGMEEVGMSLQDMLGKIFPQGRKRRRVKVSEALRILQQEEAGKLIDMDEVVREAKERVENLGIIFLDEIDKVAGRSSGHGPDVSREGVQRDLLPIIEGTAVMTKYGMVRTDHILFIAAGAFHASKPSDLLPELQGRFPIRVELRSLTREDFKLILTKPENALVKQYTALLATEGVEVEFSEDAIDEIANLASVVNERMENIGARRLYTIMEKLIEEISFNAPEQAGRMVIDGEYVRKRLADIVKDTDLSRYIL